MMRGSTRLQRFCDALGVFALGLVIGLWLGIWGTLAWLGDRPAVCRGPYPGHPADLADHKHDVEPPSTPVERPPELFRRWLNGWK